MPSNLLTADTTFPTLTREQSTDEKFDKITSYLYMLLEQLRYSMGNLDKDNFNAAGLDEIANIITEPVYVQLKDDEVVVFAWITYESRQHRDVVNAKVMADPRIAGMDTEGMPFDSKRMIWGGFETLVQA